MNMPRLRKGFTLLELLIVIALIGILVTVATASYSTIQKKTRDSRRKSDLKSVQNAMEQYYADNGQYPATQSLTCTPNGATTYIINGIPKDPKTGSAYAVSCTTAATSTYCACATMEDTNQGNASNNGSGGTCTFATSPQTFYCVGNLQ